MAVASSASVSQLTAAVPRSSFVKGTVGISSSNGLRLSPSVSFGVGNGCSRITAMATKKVTAKPKFSGKKSWLPGVKSGGDLVDPEWLDGSYVTGSLSPFCAVGSLFLCFCLFVILSSILRALHFRIVCFFSLGFVFGFPCAFADQVCAYLVAVCQEITDLIPLVWARTPQRSSGTGRRS